ncbi:GNAT family N-acetyltransferase [Lysobacter maris]|uniref:GNAT family N-acetyltransferase n=1 Tax=Marilutibacter maris TaxID=1605891 RepID=A0A508AJT3_9GAMM|nr:bifunctional GNAT family N-acetyltransferase/hotdog fold thioesterase [Lysobacter maris]KAB8179317.1 GNAT family N-acetyltransferase [Lysobacter maris]
MNVESRTNSHPELLARSQLDSNRFGLIIHRGTLEKVDERALLRELIANQVDVAILRLPAGSAGRLQKLSKYGMPPIHADTLVYYQVALESYEPRPLRNQDIAFSIATPSDMAEVEHLVEATFDGYVSHYHANPYLDRTDILAGYAEWAAGYLTDTEGRITWVARRDGNIVAFASCAFDASTDLCEGVLYGVHPDHAGGGLYGDLIRHTQTEFRKRGFQLMKVSTQVWNLAVQKVWAREGFSLTRAFDTVHINAMLSAGEALVDKSLVFSAEQVAQFAEVSGDCNPVHLDDEAARAAGFASRITHGMLAGAELSRIFGTEVPGPGTLFLRSDFIFMRPIHCGAPHRLRIRYLSEVEQGGHIPAVATIHDDRQNLCLLSYCDLLKRPPT